MWPLKHWACAGIFFAFLFTCAFGISAALLSDPEVDRYNTRIGTQTFSPRYKFTANTKLVETAEAIHAMGSDKVKFAMGKLFSGQYSITLPPSINSLTTLARDEASCRHVLDMPFRHYFIWVYTFASNGNDSWWKDGYSNSERQSEYNEVYAFAQYLLTNYNNSGKSFYFGHWEGDWYLISPDNTGVNPSPTAVQGMVDWLNNRQKAVDDALRDTPHTNVFVFNYAEANRVRDAMLNPPTSNQRVVNAVLPLVTNIDYISWSAYDGMGLDTANLHATLDYIESNLPTNKAARISGKRVILGEYGWGGTLSSAAQEAPTRGFIQKVLSWGSPFILFWQMYDNENFNYWLIDSTNTKTPCFFLHERFINRSRLLVARFKEANGRMPADVEFSSLAVPLLNQPFAAPANLTVANLPITTLTATSAVARGRVEQGIYGTEQANVWVFWGKQDGGTTTTNWEQGMFVGLNTNFNPAVFSAALTNLAPKTNYFFRFYATNSTGEAWSPSALRFTTELLATNQYGSRMKISLAGYDRAEALVNFPLLVTLSTNRAGFQYRTFAARNGGDLRFTDSTAVQPLEHEVDEWNTNGTSLVWVKVPSITSSNDFIWAYWGNPLQTNLPSYATNGSVWSQGFELVWHLKEVAFPFFDSTTKHPGTSGALPTPTPSGAIGRGSLFNGTSHHINAGLVNVGNQFTLSAWVRVDPTADSIRTIWANKAGGSATPGFALFVNSWGSRDAKLLVESGNGTDAAYAGTATNAVPSSQWKHVAAAVDRSAGKARLYVDGVDQTVSEDVRSDLLAATNLVLGRFTNGLYYFKGTMDEVRIDTELRSPDWLWATWASGVSNTTFLAYAPVSRQVPPLNASIETTNVLSLRWPSHAVGFTLQMATNLSPPVSWLPVNGQPTVLTNDGQIALSLTNASTRFYRLNSL